MRKEPCTSVGPWGRRWSTSVVVALKVMFGADRKLKDSVQKPRQDARERVLQFGATCGVVTTPLRPTRVSPPSMPWKSAEPPCAPLMCGSPLAEAVSPHCKDGGDSQTCAGWVRRANHTAPHARSESDRSHCATFHGLWRARSECETYGHRCSPTALQQDGQTARHAR